VAFWNPDVSCEMKRKTHSTLFHFDLSLLIVLFLGAASVCAVVRVDINPHGGLTDAEALYIKQRQLLYYRDEFGNQGEKVTVDPSLVFENPTIRNAYIALQA
jgi:hypothetical protein